MADLTLVCLKHLNRSQLLLEKVQMFQNYNEFVSSPSLFPSYLVHSQHSINICPVKEGVYQSQSVSQSEPRIEFKQRNQLGCRGFLGRCSHRFQWSQKTNSVTPSLRREYPKHALLLDDPVFVYAWLYFHQFGKHHHILRLNLCIH